MDERRSDVPTARASYHPAPVRRSVIPRAADAAELHPRGPMSAPLARPVRPLVAAFALLLVGAAALGRHALSSDAPTAAPTVARAVVHARPAPAPVVTPPAAPPVAEAAAVVETVAAEAPVERPRARRHHHRRRPMLASAGRSAYTLIILP